MKAIVHIEPGIGDTVEQVAEAMTRANAAMADVFPIQRKANSVITKNGKGKVVAVAAGHHDMETDEPNAA